MPKSQWLVTYSYSSMHGYITVNEVIETDQPIFTSDDLYAFKHKIAQRYANVAVLNFQLLGESEPRKKYFVSNFHYWDVADNPFDGSQEQSTLELTTVYLKHEPGIDHLIVIDGVYRRVLVVMHDDVTGDTVLFVE